MPDEISEAIARLIEGDDVPAPPPESLVEGSYGEILAGEDADISDDAVPSDDGRDPSNSDSVPCDDMDTLAFCARLDHSDTDNGLRLRTYFADDILVMEQYGHPKGGGDFLVWTGTHWDQASGTARAFKLAQRVGGLIAREADHLAITRVDLDAIEDGKKAAADFNALSAKPERTDEDTLRMKDLRAVIARAEQVSAAIAARKQARRKFGVSSKNMGRLTNMLDAAAPHLRRPPDAFNRDPFLVATLTHTLRFVHRHADDCPDIECPGSCGRWQWHCDANEGHCRDDLVTALVPVAYDAEAKAERWPAFLDRCMPSATQSDKRRTLQQFCGVGLLGIVLQYVMFHYGLGANGKSVFLETLMRVLGDSFAVSLPPETLIGKGERGAGQAAPDVMRLFGKRLLRVPEIKNDGPLQEDFIKRITGGEQITARTLFKGYIDFQNKAKPHMSGNGYPRIDGTDHGIWRRMLVMHWTETIATAEQRNFEDVVRELLTEAPAILNWLIAGAVDYLNSGFFIAEDVRAATQDYRDEMDSVGQFIRDHVESAAGVTVQARAMYDAYVAWCKVNAKHPCYETKFGRVMKTRFKRDDTARIRVYCGVRLHDVPITRRSDDGPPHDDHEVPYGRRR
jgi:putative DNA primase/helicase